MTIFEYFDFIHDLQNVQESSMQQRLEAGGWEKMCRRLGILG